MLNCWCITWPVGFKRLISSILFLDLTSGLCLPCFPANLCTIYSPDRSACPTISSPIHFIIVMIRERTISMNLLIIKFLHTALWNTQCIFFPECDRPIAVKRSGKVSDINGNIRSRVQKFPAWHTKAAPNWKCCEGYIVPCRVTSSLMWKVCWNKGRLCWKITELFYLSP